MRSLTLLFVATLLTACTGGDDADRKTIMFWHFWSEPSQRQALQRQVTEFERLHPEINVELTELSWADGKAKLQMAFNAGTAPDVVHLGLDWYGEFSHDRVFADSTLWLVNARALFESDVPSPRFFWGLCATDAHNVIKRTLPILWANGAPTFYTTVPISAGMDSALTNALWYVRSLAQRGALIERSRQLDDHLLNGDVRYLYSGAWLIDAIHQRRLTHLSIRPTPSILNGDVLAITANSKQRATCALLIDFLTDYQQARAFCLAVSDAGFPADIAQAERDTAFTSDVLRRGFLETVRLSRPLPSSPRLLSIEPVIERLIEQCYNAPSREAVQTLVAEARAEVQRTEAR